MRLRISAAVAATLLCGIGDAGANDRYCSALIDKLAGNTLYAANCTSGPNCLQRVIETLNGAVLEKADGSTEGLRPGSKYHFIYKVEPSVIQNSLVVVQFKRLENPARQGATPVPVRLKREAIPFGCSGFARNTPLAPWPPEGVSGSQLPQVAYANYDQFHRLGFTSGDDDHLLRKKFHVRYFNGQDCNSTLDYRRRWQFLMHDRTSVAGNFRAFLARLGWAPSVNEAELENMKKYEKLKVLVTNYQTAKTDGGLSASACFGFNASVGGPKTQRLEINVSDIEATAITFPFDTSRNWYFNVQ